MASLEDYHFLEVFKRKQIKLTTKGSTFTGVVQRISLNKTIILEDVVEVKSGRKLAGAKLFFGHEVLNVELVNPSKQDSGSNGEDHHSLGQLSVSAFQPYRSKLILSDEDEQYVNYIVVDEFHEKFGPAVMHIKKQQVIGIGADGVGVFQHERLCWLQIATKNKVYLFDILLLGGRAFKNGLSMILESKHILKVTHDCRSIAGCLMAQFGVNLANVFDTQVADIMSFYAETGGFLPDRVSTLQEVVSLHLKMPPSLLASIRIKSQLKQEDKDVWYVRPCAAPLLKVMALSVIHLLPLRLVLLDALMSEYTNLVGSYLSSSQDEHVHTQYIGKSGLELPKELRELELVRQERQERALQHYSITEDGLLERYKVKPTSKPQDSQSLEDPYPEQSPCSGQSLLDVQSDSLEGKPAPDLMQDFTAPRGGKLQDEGSIPFSLAVPTLGRGFTASPPLKASGEYQLCKEMVGKASSEQVDPDSLDSVTQPISIMAGVAQNRSYPAAALALGRGFFNTNVSLASLHRLSFRSSGKLC
ncbi:piRNA biogenesis protein EXD1 [Hoplias malabaricus]|uniref:piRNA biogenesis protein EXD1 n=1 Tax=Hoplias malabaricus TaxID=27720 RepID=UPI003462BB35